MSHSDGASQPDRPLLLSLDAALRLDEISDVDLVENELMFNYYESDLPGWEEIDPM